MLMYVMSGDRLAATLLAYANDETDNPSTQDALSEFARNFSAVQDYRNAQVWTTVTSVCADVIFPALDFQLLYVIDTAACCIFDIFEDF